MSLRAFRAIARTTVRFGFAAIVISFPVRGSRPLRALVAFFSTRFILRTTGRLKTPGPFLPNSALMSLPNSSKKVVTCFFDSWVASASFWNVADFVAGFGLAALFSAIAFPLVRVSLGQAHYPLQARRVESLCGI